MVPTNLTPVPGRAAEVHLTPADRATQLAEDVRTGLTAVPKDLPPKWFYDANGSLLFDEITRLPEYYPTRRERAILAERASEIAGLTRADTLVELGSGTSEKTRLLLDALRAGGHLRRFVPFDVDETVLLSAADAVGSQYPALHIHPVVGDFERHLAYLPGGGRRLIAFLGGTIGNLRPVPRAAFLTELRRLMGPDDALLLGTDLVKDTGRLIAAYDDSAGVTAAFNRNVLSVVNRELDGDLDPRGFAHVAVWDAEQEWIEMRLRSVRDQTAHVRGLDLKVDFSEGEQMRTEISAKFRPERVEAELGDAGLALQRWWTDRDGDFAVSLSTPA